MIEAVVVALLGAAAVFRIVFSATRERTIWRTTFTICIAGAAVAAALTYYGDRMDQVFETWNLSKLLLHLVLVVDVTPAGWSGSNGSLAAQTLGRKA